MLEGHGENINASALSADATDVTTGYDRTVRRWPKEQGAAPVVTALGAPLNALALALDGEAVVAGVDGAVRILAARGGGVRATVDIEAGPAVSLALSPDGARIAVGTIGGAVAVLNRASATLSFRLPGARGPVWALAFAVDGQSVLAGGNDGIIRRWDARTGEHVGTATPAGTGGAAPREGGERGAEVFRACAACHTLASAGENRAGPTLHGVFGRRIATAPGYRYSEALKGLDIVWNAETIAKLFEVGPARFTPGTKMPEQRLTAPDREALVRFLEKATRPER